MPRKPSLRKQIDDLLDQYAPVIETAFLDSIKDIRSEITLSELADNLRRGDINGALQALNLEPAAFGRVDNAIAQAYTAGGGVMANNMPTLRGASGARVVVRFDARNIRAENWLRTHSSQLITGIITDQLNGVRSVMEDGLSRAQGPTSLARDITGRFNRTTGQREGGIVGITERQKIYVRGGWVFDPKTGGRKYVPGALDELVSGDKKMLRNYLTRDRRDKRFDPTIRKAIAEGKALDSATANKIAGRYSDRLLALRGETIARTEVLASVHAAKDEAFKQGLEKTNYPPEAVTKIWRTAGDGKVRDSHEDMDEQEVKGLNTPFQSPTGAQLKHPGDSSLGAGAEDVINCRCNVDYRIQFAYGVE